MIEAPLRDRFLQGMSRAAATVNVVTTDGPAGRAGVTVSAMSSVSADGEDGGGPTMLVCVHHQSPAAETILKNGCFCANILRDDQSDISDSFAGRLPQPGGDKFACATWAAMETGAPRVVDPLTAFDCKVISGERVGTHHVFIGEVQDIYVAPDGAPLIFANRSYGTPVQLGAGPQGRAVAGRLSVGALHTIGPYILPGVLRELAEEIGEVDVDIHEGDQAMLARKLRAGEIDLAFVYDIRLGRGFAKIPITDLTPYVLMAEGSPLAARDRLTLADLVAEPMVLLNSPPSRDYFLGLFDGIAAPNVAYQAQSFEMVRGLVAHGLGYTLLATKPVSPMSYDGKALTMRPLADHVRPSRLVLAQREGAERSAVAETFILHCINSFGLDND